MISIIVVLSISLIGYTLQSGTILCERNVAENGDINIVELLHRIGEFEKRDRVTAVEKNTFVHQMNDVLSKLDFVIAENQKLNKRVTEIENKNVELRNELMDIKSKQQVNVGKVNDQGNVIIPWKFIGQREEYQKREHIVPQEKVSNVQRIRRVENEADVAFYALLDNHLLHEGANQNIAFDRIVTNVGNAYNSHSGDFRAPVAGTYVFSVSLMAYSTHTTHYFFAMNGKEVGKLYVRGQESPKASTSATIVLRLNAGDDVAVRNVDPDEQLHGESYSSLSGFLLQQDYPLTSGTIIG